MSSVSVPGPDNSDLTGVYIGVGVGVASIVAIIFLLIFLYRRKSVIFIAIY